MKTISENDVEKLAVALTGDPGVVDGMRKHRQETQFIYSLIQMRNAKGMNQREMAKKMGVSPSKLCRMEASADTDLSFGDIQAYVSALDMDMSILFDSPSLPASTRIKQHVVAVHALLQELCKISKQVGGGDDITRKIKAFYAEVLLNFLLGFEKSYSKLPFDEPLQFPAPRTTKKVRVARTVSR